MYGMMASGSRSSISDSRVRSFVDAILTHSTVCIALATTLKSSGGRRPQQRVPLFPTNHLGIRIDCVKNDVGVSHGDIT